MAEDQNKEQSGSLFVGNLHRDIMESTLFEKFSKIGPLISIRVCKDKTTTSSLGYAYVNFQNRDDAYRAMHMMNFDMVNGKPIRIMWAQTNPALRRSAVGNVFVKNLVPKINNQALYDIFAGYGTIVSSKLAMDNNNQSKGYGFVQYESEESALKAIEKLNGKLLHGRMLYVSKFMSRTERQNQLLLNFTNIYVKNLSDSVDDEKLRELFHEFGNINSAKVMMDGSGESRGFGFVNFEKSEDAQIAVSTMNGITLDTRKLYVCRAQKKHEREKYLSQKASSNNSNSDNGNFLNIFVKNLPEDYDDYKLKQLFECFGETTSVRVMFDENGKSKCFGFVNFVLPEAARKAVTELNGNCMDGQILYVSRALNERNTVTSLPSNENQPSLI